MNTIKLTKAQSIKFAEGFNAKAQRHNDGVNDGVNDGGKSLGRGWEKRGYDEARFIVLDRQFNPTATMEDIVAPIALIKAEDSQKVWDDAEDRLQAKIAAFQARKLIHSIAELDMSRRQKLFHGWSISHSKVEGTYAQSTHQSSGVIEGMRCQSTWNEFLFGSLRQIKVAIKRRSSTSENSLK